MIKRHKPSISTEFILPVSFGDDRFTSKIYLLKIFCKFSFRFRDQKRGQKWNNYFGTNVFPLFTEIFCSLVSICIYFETWRLSELNS